MPTTEHYIQELGAYLANELDARTRAAMKLHLEECPGCRSELASLESIWRTLGRSADELPDARVSERFYATLDALTPERERVAAGYERRAPARGSSTGWIERLGWLIPRQGAVQFAMVLAVLAVGGLIGYSVQGNGSRTEEMAQLREEVRSVSRLLIFSLLQQQSATERLQGVSWSYRVDDRDPEITSALLRTLAEDANVNVRLAALDALSRNLDEPSVRDGLVESLPRQTSPMIQLAILDVVVSSNLRESAGALQELLKKPGINETVKRRLEEAINHLTT
jgi:hypothetical protein